MQSILLKFGVDKDKSQLLGKFLFDIKENKLQVTSNNGHFQ